MNVIIAHVTNTRPFCVNPGWVCLGFQLNKTLVIVPTYAACTVFSVSIIQPLWGSCKLVTTILYYLNSVHSVPF